MEENKYNVTLEREENKIIISMQSYGTKYSIALDDGVTLSTLMDKLDDYLGDDRYTS